MKRGSGFLTLLTFIFAAVLTVSSLTAQGQRQGQRGRAQSAGPPMDSTPRVFDTAEYKIRVVTVAEGLAYPYSFAFLPDGSIIVSELQGRLRMIRDGKFLSEPFAQIPNVHFAAGRGGFMDIVLHPKFGQNRWVYFTYDKEGENGATQAVARGTIEGNKLTDVKDVFVADNWGKAGGHLSARINFGRDGMLYMAISDHNVPANVATGTSHAGKVMTGARCHICGHVVIGDRHVQHAVSSKVDTSRKMPAGFPPIIGDENVLNVRQFVSLDRPAGNRLGCTVFSLFVVGKVHPAILSKLRMENNVHEPAAPGSKVHVGYLRNRLTEELAVANHPQTTLQFADDDASVGQKCERVGIDEPFGDSDDTNLVFRCVEYPRCGIHRRPGRLRPAALPLTLPLGCQAADRQKRRKYKNQ